MFVGCSKSKDSNPSNGNNTYVAPTLAKDTLIKIPEPMRTKAENGDYTLAAGIAQIDFVNAFSSGLTGAFFYDQSTINGWNATSNNDGSVSYTWSALQYKVKLTYYHSSSESWWKYEEDSASYSYPFYYVSDKGTSGETDWYSQSGFKGQSYTVYKDVWSIANNIKTSTFNIYDTNSTNIETQYVSISNPDKSGSLKIYNRINSQLVLQWYYVWDKNGAGTYTKYQDDGTTIDNSMSGTF
jgi:hypothetical protein